MCGRTACTLSPDVLCKACCFKRQSGDSNQYVPAEWKESSSGKAYQPSTNFSPTFYGPVMISKKLIDPSSASQDRVIEPMMWGMIPPWHTGTPTKHGLTTNNCRIEGITEKKLFKEPLAKGNRCVVLFDGFYEWKAAQGKGSAKKQPYLIYVPQPEGISVAEPDTWENLPSETLWSQEEGWKGPRPMMVAGLFDSWKSPEDGTVIKSYSVVTMDSNSAFSWIHERMPAILDTQEEVDAWLDSAHVTPQQALSKLKASVNFVVHPVSAAVGSVKNQERSLTRPIDPEKPKPLSGSGKFMANWLGKKESPTSSVSTLKADNELVTSGGVKRKLVSSNSDPEKLPVDKLKKESVEKNDF